MVAPHAADFLERTAPGAGDKIRVAPVVTRRWTLPILILWSPYLLRELQAVTDSNGWPWSESLAMGVSTCA